MQGCEATQWWSPESGVLENGSSLCSATDAVTAATKKWKVDASGKMVTKKEKVAPVKKVSVLKIVLPKLRPGPRGTSEIELTLMKPIGVSKKFCFSDVPSSSLGQRNEVGPTAQMPGGMVTKAAGERAAHVIRFAGLGDSSPNTHGPSTTEKIVVANVLMHSVPTPS
jgi:hypothetical protein